MSFTYNFKPLPTADEETEYGTRIAWTKVVVRVDEKNPTHNNRYVPVTCRCGITREMDVLVLKRAKYRGCCQVCASTYCAPRGPRHSDWKNGIWYSEDGYRFLHMELLSSQDQALARPMLARSRPYIAEHRLVVARRLGRPLLRDEHVHHRDANKLNNDDSNLEVVTPSHHAAVELVRARAEIKRLRALVALLLATGALGKGG